MKQIVDDCWPCRGMRRALYRVSSVKEISIGFRIFVSCLLFVIYVQSSFYSLKGTKLFLYSDATIRNSHSLTPETGATDIGLFTNFSGAIVRSFFVVLFSLIFQFSLFTVDEAGCASFFSAPVKNLALYGVVSCYAALEPLCTSMRANFQNIAISLFTVFRDRDVCPRILVLAIIFA